jgi:hypothetical protein
VIGGGYRFEQVSSEEGIAVNTALWISIAVLVCLAAGRVWLGYHFGELRHAKRRIRPH